MAEFMIALRGYDMAEVDRLIARGEQAAASSNIGLRATMRAELSSAHLRRRIRGYAPHQVDRAIKDLMARLG